MTLTCGIKTPSSTRTNPSNISSKLSYVLVMITKITQTQGVITKCWFGWNCWNFSGGLTCQGLLGRYVEIPAKTRPHGRDKFYDISLDISQKHILNTSLLISATDFQITEQILGCTMYVPYLLITSQPFLIINQGSHCGRDFHPPYASPSPHSVQIFYLAPSKFQSKV